jgi:hypothetical protein
VAVGADKFALGNLLQDKPAIVAAHQRRYVVELLAAR